MTWLSEQFDDLKLKQELTPQELALLRMYVEELRDDLDMRPVLDVVVQGRIYCGFKGGNHGPGCHCGSFPAP